METKGSLGRFGPTAAKLIAALMLFAAIVGHSYDYYTILRWVVCGVCIFSAWQAWGQQSRGWVVALGCMAALFNPLIPVHLKRETWAVVDVAAGVLLLISIRFMDRITRKESNER